MAKVNTVVQCTICEEQAKIDFTKPSAFQPTVVRHTCKNCETKFLYRILSDRSKEHRGIKIETKVLFVTEAVRQQIAKKVEDKKAKAAERAKRAIAELSQNKGEQDVAST